MVEETTLKDDLKAVLNLMQEEKKENQFVTLRHSMPEHKGLYNEGQNHPLKSKKQPLLHLLSFPLPLISLLSCPFSHLF